MRCPHQPHIVYDEWEGWRVFLGIVWLDFETARCYVRSLGIKSLRDWNVWCKSGNRPSNIPSSPPLIYINQWSGYKDWLGTEYLSFEYARNCVQKLSLHSSREYRIWWRRSRPGDVPAKPEKTYAEWKGWGDFLGTGYIQDQQKKYRSFEDARSFVVTLHLKNREDWKAYCRSGNKPEDIPRGLARSYANEWQGWSYFLGTNRPKQKTTNSKIRKRKKEHLAIARHLLEKHGGMLPNIKWLRINGYGDLSASMRAHPDWYINFPIRRLKGEQK